MADDTEVFAKISRNGEAFWVGDIRQLEEGVYVGTVSNDLGDPRFPLGRKIAFVDAEWNGEIQQNYKGIPGLRPPPQTHE